MKYKSVLHEMSETTPTQFWNDNCSETDLTLAIEHGAVGATSNPVIVGQVLEGELEKYKPNIKKLIAERPTATEDEIAWLVCEDMAVNGARLLEPVYDRTKGAAGYISIQTNAKYYRDTARMVEQATYFKTLAPNIMVKMPMTKAGVAAAEETTYRGVNINATVSFSVPQAIAVAEAVERGLKRRETDGLSNAGLHPVCTIMVGRVEDWLREVADKEGIIVDPAALAISGVAVFKQAYQIFKQRGYRTRLLAAAIRSVHHWADFIGGDVSITIPPSWIKRFIASDTQVENKMEQPVDSRLLGQLQKHFADFNRAYEPDGMLPEDFVSFGSTRKTLMQFLNGYDKTVGIIRGLMING
jgi:transaldolase